MFKNSTSLSISHWHVVRANGDVSQNNVLFTGFEITVFLRKCANWFFLIDLNFLLFFITDPLMSRRSKERVFK